MKKTLNIAAVGTGPITDVMLDAVRRTPGLKCTLIYSRDLTRAENYARSVGASVATDDFDTMLNDPSIDIVYIATPNSLHVEQALRVLKAGKHAIIEKPIAVKESDVLTLANTARENRVFFFEAITTLFMPSYLALKGIVRGFGAPLGVDMRYGFVSSKMAGYLAGNIPNNMRRDTLGGVLNDIGVYAIFPAIDLFGEPEGVDYIAQIPDDAADMSGVLTLKYPSFNIVVELAKDRELNCGSEFRGERGCAWQRGHLNAFENCGGRILDVPIKIDIPPYKNRMVFEAAAFRDAILNDDTAMFEYMANISRAVAKVLEEASVL